MQVGHFPASAANSLIEGYCDDFISLAAVLAQTLEQVTMRDIDISRSSEQLTRIESGMRNLAQAIHELLERGTSEAPKSQVSPGEVAQAPVSPTPSPSPTPVAAASPATRSPATPPPPLEKKAPSTKPTSSLEAWAPATGNRKPADPADPSRRPAGHSAPPTPSKPDLPAPSPTPKRPVWPGQTVQPIKSLTAAELNALPASNTKPANNPGSAQPKTAASKAANQTATKPASNDEDLLGLHGNNASMPLLSVFQFIERMRKSGIMTVKLAQETMKFEFDRGCVQSCVTDQPAPKERLGELLLETTNCDRQKLRALLADNRGKTPRQIGERVVQAKLATSGQVMAALEAQVRSRFMRARADKNATYSFLDCTQSDTDGRIRIAPMELGFQSGRNQS